MSAADGWHDVGVPAQQAALAAGEFIAWKAGARHGPFDALARLIPRANPTHVLEVGSGSGHNAAWFASEWPGAMFEGCDYSPAMVDFARKAHPHARFTVGDQRDLPYVGATATALAPDLLLHGCALIHLSDIGDWLAALCEAARVSSRWVLLHRTPVRPPGLSVQHVTKHAYGVEIHETHVPQAALDWLLESAGLREVRTEAWNLGQDPTQASILCEVLR